MCRRTIVAIACWVLADAVCGMEGWAPKFYNGHEGEGEVRLVADGYMGKDPALLIRHVSGQMKFGAEKKVSTALKGVVEWKVEADIRCGKKSIAAVAMEFFGKKDRSLGVKDGKGVCVQGWSRQTWRFVAPPDTVKASVHLLSLSKGPVLFAHVTISSAPGKETAELPLDVKALPAEWNRDWNGGQVRCMSFSDAPIPIAFHFKGEKSRLSRPAFELDVPDELELKDAFNTHFGYPGASRPVSRTAHLRDGVPYVRLRFEKLQAFTSLEPKFGFERKLAVVLGPKAGREDAEKTFAVYYRVADNARAGEEKAMELELRPMPKGLKQAKRFPVLICWKTCDRLFSDEGAFVKSLKAYEAAGLTCWRRYGVDGLLGPRVSVLEKRPCRWNFSAGFADVTRPKFLNSDSAEFKALDVRMDVKAGGGTTGRLCPEYVNGDPSFRKYLAETVVPSLLKRTGMQSGEMVTLDIEPWESYGYCLCDTCLKAFAEQAGLDHVPAAREIRKDRDDWALFRCRQSEKTIEMLSKAIKAYDPTLKVYDYDYIMDYGEPGWERRRRSCAKDAQMNEKWLDGHICSYYHRVGVASFRAIRNNVRNLKKPYIPMGAIEGGGTYLRQGEVMSPRDYRMLALAAFVNGCPGYGVFSGVHISGEHMLEMMRVQDEVARWEHLPWGRREGNIKIECASDQFEYASTVSDDGETVLALFNYDRKEPVSVRVGSRMIDVAPKDVVFAKSGAL